MAYNDQNYDYHHYYNNRVCLDPTKQIDYNSPSKE